MAIVTPPPPPQARQALQDALQFLLTRPGDATAAAIASVGGAVEQLQSTQPHARYALGIDELAQGKYLESARANGWRYLLVSTPPFLVASADVAPPTNVASDVGGGLGAPEPVAVAEASVAADAQGNAVCTGVAVGPTVSATVDAVLDLEQAPAVQGGDFELRYLEVAALSFFALWLHGDGGDLLRPIAPTPLEVADPVVMDAGQLQASLQSLAQSLVQQQAQAGDESGG